MTTRLDEGLVPKLAATVKRYVKRQPTLRIPLVMARKLWQRLLYLYLIRRSGPEREVAEKTIPALRHFTRGSCSILTEMRATFREYTGNVSYEGMPISLESACFLWSLCEATTPMRILDLGSGFSSFVFRRYQSEASVRPEVWSVDESAQWLEKTRAFLLGRGLTDDNLYTWDEFQKMEPGCFDLISHDLGLMDDRPDILEQMLALKKRDGKIIIDDLHNVEYRRELKKRLRRYDLIEGYSLRWLTLDKHLRYSLMVGQRT